MNVEVKAKVGSFAENKEQARKLRSQILPVLKRREGVVLDFAGVTLATQSFIHAVIAEAIRDPALNALDLISFANCADNVRAVIEVVVSYCQDEWDEDEMTDVETEDARA